VSRLRTRASTVNERSADHRLTRRHVASTLGFDDGVVSELDLTGDLDLDTVADLAPRPRPRLDLEA
jgi:hypothetical protein